jgi:hypothetical protein
VKLLRRVLYWAAALWMVAGVALVLAPGWLVEDVFHQPAVGDAAWLRAAGVMAIALALLMVLLAHHLDEVWWWTWTFVVLEAGTAAVFLLHALVSVPKEAPAWPWWLLGLANGLFAAFEVAGLAQVGVKRSPV